MEIWRPVKGYEGHYEVSNKGRIKSLASNRLLSPHNNGVGYLKVELWKDKVGKKKYIHRIVADTFLPNPLNRTEVNHKDSDPANNTLENLEWVSSSENTKHAVYKGALSAWGNAAKPIEAIDIATGRVKQYATISEAEREIGSMHITDVLKGKRHQCKGFFFRYLGGGDENANFSYLSTE